MVGGRGKRQTSEIYDPLTNAWITLSDTNVLRAEHIAVALSDGGALVAGGTGNRNSIGIYDPVLAT